MSIEEIKFDESRLVERAGEMLFYVLCAHDIYYKLDIYYI